MNKRITMIVVSTYSNTSEIVVYFYRDLDEFPKKAYSVNNTFWHRVRYNRVVNTLLDAGRIKLTEQHVVLGGTVEMIFVPVDTVKANPLDEIEFANEPVKADDITNTLADLETSGYKTDKLSFDTVMKIAEKTQRSDVSYWDALEAAADYFNVPTRADQDEW